MPTQKEWMTEATEMMKLEKEAFRLLNNETESMKHEHQWKSP